MSDDLTPAQLDEIVATAKKATPGEWAHDEFGEVLGSNGESLFFGDAAGYGLPISRAIAEHVAMMDPATTLALVAEVRALRAKVERVRAEVDAEVQRAQHRPGESKPDAIRRSMSRAITGRIIDALGEEA